MKKWMLSAIVYLLVVIGGYMVYDSVAAEPPVENNHGEEHEEVTDDENAEESHGHEEEDSNAEDHGEGASHEHEEGTDNGVSEVNVALNVDNDTMIIDIQDMDQKPVSELEINHEKLVHLIVVDEHLDKYYHLHPEQVGEGKFQVNQELPEGSYKAFVDIKPSHLNYVVSPIAFTIGEESEGHAHGELTADESLTKVVDGHQVTLIPSSLVSGEAVTLNFDIKDAQLEPYLGAMGHVVILDQAANEYLHVHPADHEQPIFETTFSEPGIYKIWAEFKQNGKVSVYPFVVEIK
ncbi:hypothetical protein ACFYKX_21165 [Cytobacillus sp. FJAT-54145]|uniref:Secreted protein n=1 Tax=Cytobacillus spartinae TaxID=3299023 RepID=A0ABW6KFT3_9BACI